MGGQEVCWIRRSRVDACATHILEATSILSMGDVEDFNDAFPLPSDYQYVFPQPGNTVVDIDLANTVAIHFESLRGGLRLPLHPFIRAILDLHNSVARSIDTEHIYRHSCVHHSVWSCWECDPTLKCSLDVSTRPLEDGKTGEMTTDHWGVSTRRREVYTKPIERMRSYLSDEMVLGTHLSTREKTFGAVVPSCNT
ncbi:hypothetical protein Dimus_003100 [Dionaea muscipula]